MDRPLTVLLIEDDAKECMQIENCMDLYDEIDLVAVTNNSKDALELTQYHMPDAVILDLELHHGGGNGFQYLKELAQLCLSHIPYILITTNNSSSVTLEYARRLGADFILAKYESGYSAQYVVDFLKMMQDIIISKGSSKTLDNPYSNSPEYQERKLRQRIQRELDFVGIRPSAIGYRYLTDAIALIYHNPESNISATLANIHKKNDFSIERAMQNAINHAWQHTDIEALLKHYTARIRHDKSAPTNMEFIYYYANKLQNEV